MDVKERDWGFGLAWVIAFDSGWGRRVKKEKLRPEGGVGGRGYSL